MGVLIANDILQDVALALIEKYLPSSQQLTTAVGAPGAVHINLTGLAQIYVGAQLICGTAASGTLEIITVSSTDGTGFTATFAKAHPSTDPLYGATFPSGAPDHFLFTQSEMLAYLADVQNLFLLQVRPIFKATTGNFAPGTRIYTQPSDCIRLERIALDGLDLWNTTQQDLDMEEADWSAETGKPTHWFQDRVDVLKYGVHPMPQVLYTADVWYAQAGSATLVLTDSLLVPDICAHALKYGVLARAFGKDGEMRDQEREQYCQKRFDLVVKLTRNFMEGMHAEPQMQQQQPQQGQQGG